MNSNDLSQYITFSCVAELESFIDVKISKNCWKTPNKKVDSIDFLVSFDCCLTNELNCFESFGIDSTCFFCLDGFKFNHKGNEQSLINVFVFCFFCCYKNSKINNKYFKNKRYLKQEARITSISRDWKALIQNKIKFVLSDQVKSALDCNWVTASNNFEASDVFCCNRNSMKLFFVKKKSKVNCFFFFFFSTFLF